MIRMAEKNRKIYWIKPFREGDWTVDAEDRKAEEVKDFIKGISVKNIENAGAAYMDACSVVADAQSALGQQAEALAKVWEGKASVEAQKALRTLYLALHELSAKLNAMGRPLQTLARVVRIHQEFLEGELPEQKGNPLWTKDSKLGGYTFNGVLHPGEHSVEWAGLFRSRDELAGQHLEAFSNDLKAIYDGFPDTVEKELPAIAYPVKPQEQPKTVRYPVGETPFGGATSPYSVAPGGDSGGTDLSSWDHDRPNTPETPKDQDIPGPGPGDGQKPGIPSSGADPSTDNSNAKDSARVDPTPSLNSSARGSDDQTPGLHDPGLNQPIDSGPGSRTELEGFHSPATADTTAAYLPTSPNQSVSPSTSPGSGTGIGSGSTTAVVPATMNGAPATASTGAGMPFMPTGGTGGQEKEGPQADTWLHEDDEVWGVNTDDVVTDTIG
ncbi:hypothetical protein ABZ297_07600 [Nonomuraea sp. NPDC005983]|uniref:hypothetical protein n=1 Tax=Nonomuraea sp. NPDC005983 TaxID=3155595 RepID=UPI0033BC0218